MLAALRVTDDRQRAGRNLSKDCVNTYKKDE